MVSPALKAYQGGESAKIDLLVGEKIKQLLSPHEEL